MLDTKWMSEFLQNTDRRTDKRNFYDWRPNLVDWYVTVLVGYILVHYYDQNDDDRPPHRHHVQSLTLSIHQMTHNAYNRRDMMPRHCSRRDYSFDKRYEPDPVLAFEMILVPQRHTLYSKEHAMKTCRTILWDPCRFRSIQMNNWKGSHLHTANAWLFINKDWTCMIENDVCMYQWNEERRWNVEFCKNDE